VSRVAMVSLVIVVALPLGSAAESRLLQDGPASDVDVYGTADAVVVARVVAQREVRRTTVGFDARSGTLVESLVLRNEIEVAVETVLRGHALRASDVVRVETLSRLDLSPGQQVLLPVARVINRGFQLKSDRYLLIRSNAELDAVALWLALVDLVHPDSGVEAGEVGPSVSPDDTQP